MYIKCGKFGLLIFWSILNVCMGQPDKLLLSDNTLNVLDNGNGIRHHQKHPSTWNTENFLLVDYLNDGEVERRISYNGLTGKETSIGDSRYVLYDSNLLTLYKKKKKRIRELYFFRVSFFFNAFHPF